MGRSSSPLTGRSSRTGTNPVSAVVLARRHMRDPVDLGVGHHLTQKTDFARAGLAVPEGDLEDGAVVLDDVPGPILAVPLHPPNGLQPVRAAAPAPALPEGWLRPDSPPRARRPPTGPRHPPHHGPGC